MIYIVKRGDNLTKIAREYGTSVRELVEANNIKNPNRIFVGDVLTIPEPETPAVEPAKSLLVEFLTYLEAQVGHIYVWGAQGQILTDMANPENWIRGRETSTKNAERAITLYRKRAAEGMNPIKA